MKLSTIQRIKTGNKPLRSFNELACEFNLTPPQLRGKLHGIVDRPKPELHTGRKDYYKPEEFRAWFVQRFGGMA